MRLAVLRWSHDLDRAKAGMGAGTGEESEWHRELSAVHVIVVSRRRRSAQTIMGKGRGEYRVPL